MIFLFAVKYPFTALAADKNGRPNAKILRLEAAFVFFIRYFPAGSAMKYSRSIANAPKKIE